jgi:hypothetical protein
VGHRAERLGKKSVEGEKMILPEGINQLVVLDPLQTGNFLRKGGSQGGIEIGARLMIEHAAGHGYSEGAHGANLRRALRGALGKFTNVGRGLSGQPRLAAEDNAREQ